MSSYVLYPVIKLQEKIVIPLQEYASKRKKIATLYTEYQALENRYDELEAEYIAMKGAQSVYDDIEELVAFKKRYDQSSAYLAHIIARQLSEQRHTFLVDAGSNCGIEIDMVAVYKNCLVGRVIEVYPQYSKVLAMSDQSCQIAGICTKTKACGIYHGNNTLESATFSHVSHLTPVQVGDMVLSSGQGLLFPRGFGLGTIKSCSKEGLFYSIELEPLVNLKAISYCYLLKK